MFFKPTIRVSNSGQIAAHFMGASTAVVSAVNKGVAEATLAIHQEAVRGIQKVSSGKRVTRYNPKRERIVSKPGDPPNVDFAVFLRSVQFEVVNNTGLVGSNDERAVWFEFGTSKMAARPWLFPAFKAAEKKIKSIFKALKIGKI